MTTRHLLHVLRPAQRRAMTAQWGALVALVLVGCLLVATGSNYQSQLLFSTCLFAVLGYGWNLISGLTGYISFGQVSFFGIAAYGTALLMLHLSLPAWGAIALAALIAAGVAVPLGLIMLRLRGIFFALGMFGLARICEIIATSVSFTGGASGMTVPLFAGARTTAAVMLGIAVAAFGLTALTLRSRLGLRLVAIRDDETAAAAAGVGTWMNKIVAFALSALLAAIAGGMYAWNLGYLDPGGAFDPTLDLQIILIVLIGGIGTKWGPLIGAVIIEALSEFLGTSFPQQEEIVLGLLTILCIVFLPGGLVSLVDRVGWGGRRPIWYGPSEAPAGPPSPAEDRVADGTPVLRCEGISRRFGGVEALSGVDVEARPGEVLAVIGPNGAGKTTLFNVISGFDRPNAGRVRFLGRDVTRRQPHRHARDGITRTFQTQRLFPSLTVWETVLLSAITATSSKAEAQRRTTRALRTVRLLDKATKLPEHLPPGQQRLVEIGRALTLAPKVLLLDEAMASMTPAEIARVQSVLRDAASDGCAIMAIEHVLPAMAPIADRVQVLDFGKTIAEGRPGDVLRQQVVIDAYLGTEESASDHDEGSARV